jgi:hypothetical protein
MTIADGTGTVRRHVRVACNAAAVITTADDTFAGVCQNISLGGAYFSGDTAPASGSITFTLCLPSMGPVELVGEVRPRAPTGCGIRFTQIPYPALTAICAYVAGSR